MRTYQWTVSNTLRNSIFQFGNDRDAAPPAVSARTRSRAYFRRLNNAWLANTLSFPPLRPTYSAPYSLARISEAPEGNKCQPKNWQLSASNETRYVTGVKTHRFRFVNSDEFVHHESPLSFRISSSVRLQHVDASLQHLFAHITSFLLVVQHQIVVEFFEADRLENALAVVFVSTSENKRGFKVESEILPSKNIDNSIFGAILRSDLSMNTRASYSKRLFCRFMHFYQFYGSYKWGRNFCILWLFFNRYFYFSVQSRT